jgi:hypothetical protein
LPFLILLIKWSYKNYPEGGLLMEDTEEKMLDEQVEVLATTEETTAEPPQESSLSLEEAGAEIHEPVIAAAEIAEPVIAPVQTESYADAPVKKLDKNESEIKTKWNWGAFSFTMWFGIGNRAYLGLLILLGMVPWIGWIFAIVWMIIFGLNGEKWALQNHDNNYRDEEEFRKIMDSWNRAGFIGFIIGAAVLVLSLIVLAIVVGFAFNNLDLIHNQINQNYRGNY